MSEPAEETDRVLLRLRRTLGHGSSGGTGRRIKDRVSHCRRDRRLEEGKRAAGALSFGLTSRRLQLSSHRHSQASVIISSISNPLPYTHSDHAGRVHEHRRCSAYTFAGCIHEVIRWHNTILSIAGRCSPAVARFSLARHSGPQLCSPRALAMATFP